mgnify:CR=1 FL=1
MRHGEPLRHLSEQSNMFNHEACIFHDRNFPIFQDGDAFLTSDAELHPEQSRRRRKRDGLGGVPGAKLGRSENINYVDGNRDICQPGKTVQIPDFFPRRMDRHDLVTGCDKVPSHPVNRVPGGILGPDNGNRSAALKQGSQFSIVQHRLFPPAKQLDPRP